jgi:hypothetical protein
MSERMHIMNQAQSSDIQLKLTHNRDQRMPRNFFVHLFNVPQNVTVQIEYDEQVLPISRNTKSIDARFWVAPDKAVNITISKEDIVLAAGKYLVHDETIFEGLTILAPRIPLQQIAYMFGTPD